MILCVLRMIHLGSLAVSLLLDKMTKNDWRKTRFIRTGGDVVESEYIMFTIMMIKYIATHSLIQKQLCQNKNSDDDDSNDEDDDGDDDDDEAKKKKKD